MDQKLTNKLLDILVIMETMKANTLIIHITAVIKVTIKNMVNIIIEDNGYETLTMYK